MILAGCGIGNLVSSHTLDWFFYRSCRGDDGGFPDSGTGSCSLGSRFENYKLPLAFGSFTCSLEILLLVCCLYSGGTWFLGGRDGGTIRFCPGISAFFTAFSSITFVYGRQKRLPISADGDRTSDTSASDLLSVSRRNLVSCSSRVSVLFGLSLFILPVLFISASFVRVDGRAGKLSMYLLIETAFCFFFC